MYLVSDVCGTQRLGRSAASERNARPSRQGQSQLLSSGVLQIATTVFVHRKFPMSYSSTIGLREVQQFLPDHYFNPPIDIHCCVKALEGHVIATIR
jgi:hypothetical protein